MRSAAAEAGVRIIGPNCLGVIRPAAGLNASFAVSTPRAGHIGLLSQSGALVTGILSYADSERFGLSAAVSLGAKADVEDEDVMRWLADDDATKVLAVYVEAFREPREFLAAARDVAGRKPVVAIKGGTTAAGAKAASSHTGSLAGSGAAYSAAFAQAGVLEARSVADFIGWSQALAMQPPAKGDRVAIVTNAGGPGVLAADAADRSGMRLAELSETTLAKLNEVMPSVWSRSNPVDVIGDATPQRYVDALSILGAADEVDGIVVIMTVQAMTDPETTAKAIADTVNAASWSLPVCGSFIGLTGTEVGSYLDARGIPEFNTPEDAVSAMGALVRRGAWLRREELSPSGDYGMPAPQPSRARAALTKANELGQKNLDLALAREVLEAAGLRYNRSGIGANEDEAVAVAVSVGYPVVLKLISPDVIHKSDVGGVVLGVADEAGVRAACAAIRQKVESHQPGARIDGFTVEEQVSGTEIIVGMSRDPDFGPLLMVGMGGVFVEVYKDVAFRLLPLTRRDAHDMIGEIKAQALFDGARKRPKLDRGELVEAIMRISALVEEHPEIVELDVNPLVITDEGLVCIDARVII
jgi:acetyltransferase